MGVAVVIGIAFFIGLYVGVSVTCFVILHLDDKILSYEMDV
jgi:hypothetical protein